MKYKIALLFILSFGCFTGSALFAQEKNPAPENKPPENNSPENKPPETPAGETAADGENQTGTGETGAEPAKNPGLIYYGRREPSRLRWTVGFGRGEVKPGVVSEASSSWFLNSAIRSSLDSTYQPVLPLDPGNAAKYWSFSTGLEYAYLDRIFVTANWFRINLGLVTQNSTTVTFLHPPSNAFRWSYFEGMRLARYKEDRRSVELKYLHPVLLRGLKVGPYIAREWYREDNDISYGSFQATSGSSSFLPGHTAWSAAGAVPGNYKMAGWVVGPAFRYKIFDWFGLQYKLGIVSRKGGYNQGGYQIMTVSEDATGATQYHALYPFASARASDSGIRHVLEAEFCIYCRFTITVGLLKEDLSRTYESYGGYTFATLPYFYSQKTPLGLGIGETANSHELSKQEIYVKFGTDIFF